MTNKKDGNVLSSYSYTYGYDGNQTSKTDHKGRVDTYTYDNLGRLKTENDYVYSYDYAGNRIKKTYNREETTNYTYDKNNRIIKAINLYDSDIRFREADPLNLSMTIIKE